MCASILPLDMEPLRARLISQGARYVKTTWLSRKATLPASPSKVYVFIMSCLILSGVCAYIPWVLNSPANREYECY